MAQKRMFSLSVVDTDKFLEMPISSRLLYYELGMRADDDGFVNNWKKILLFTGLKEDDMKVLISKQFIIPFESGVIVIRHWRLNNYLQKDRTKPTIYQEELAQLNVDNNNVYNLYTDCIHSIVENSIEENSIVYSMQPAIEFYNNNFNLITPFEVEKLNEYSDMESDLIIYAMKKAIMKNVRNFSYVDSILKAWKKKGFKKLIQAQNEDMEFRQSKQPKEETQEEKRKRLLKVLEEVDNE